MSDLLSRLKARLESGQNLASSPSEDSGWVRAALIGLEEEENHGEFSADANRVDHITSSSFQDAIEPEGSDTEFFQWRRRTAAANEQALEASRQFWERGIFEGPLPTGFYLATPRDNETARTPSLPNYEELSKGNHGSWEVLLLDLALDPILRRLQQLATVATAGLDSNIQLALRRLAEIVVDMYGGPLLEAATVPSGPFPMLLGSVQIGSCRPRAMLLKLLCDTVGISTRLIMGLGLDAAESGRASGWRHMEHLANAVVLGGQEVLVDVMLHPGRLRALTGRGLRAYHLGSSGHSDSIDSWEPAADHLAAERDSTEHEASSPRLRMRRRGAPPPPPSVAPVSIPLTAGGMTFSPSSDSDLVNRRRSRRRAPSDERGMLFSSSPEHVHAVGRAQPQRPMEDINSVPSSPEHPMLRVRAPSVLSGGRRAGGDELLAASYGTMSPEHPSHMRFRHRPLPEDSDAFTSSPEHAAGVDGPRHWMARRRVGPENHDFLESPEQSPQHPMFLAGDGRPPLAGSRPSSVAGDDTNPSSSAEVIAERRISDLRQGGSCSSDWDVSGQGGDIVRFLNRRRFILGPEKAPVLPSRSTSGGYSTGGDRRLRRRNAAPQISDDVVRAVRAVNEAMRREKHGMRDASGGGHAVGSPDHSPSLGGQLLCPWCHHRVGGRTPLLQPDAEANEEPQLRRLHRLGIDVPQPHAPAPAEGATVYSSDVPSMEPPRPQVRRCNSQPELGPSVGLSAVQQQSPGSLGARLPLTSTVLASLPHETLLPFPEWTIDFSELRIGVRVGIGSFGEVFRGIWRGTEVAIKVLLEQDLTRDNMDDFSNEISLLSRLRHPNVILFLGACLQPPHLSMVTEYMHTGSLYRLIHSSGQGQKLSWRRRLKMLRDICRGMMCVQRMSIVHRDLKSANCLVDKHWAVKVCDFGLSRIAHNSVVAGRTAAGTPQWMAPELLRNEAVTWRCDVFSLGVIMWELCTLKRPWEGLKPMQVIHAVAYEHARLQVPEGMLGGLISECWSEDPEMRPSFEGILTRLQECEFLQT